MERCSMVISESRAFPRDFGISRLGFDGPRLESWNKDGEHGEHLRALGGNNGIYQPSSIDQCRQAW